MSSKLKEIENGESESNSEGDEFIKKKIMEKRDERIARLSEPKFRIVKRCSNDIFYRQRYPPYNCVPYERVECNDPKRTITRKGDEVTGDVGKIDDDNKRKMKSLTIQNGPPLNIDRELTKQNLGCVNISPDASFVRDNSNVNVYMFLHESCKNDKTPRDDNDIDRRKIKETIDDIDESSTRNRSIVKDFERVKGRDEIIEEDVTKRYKSFSKDANDSYSKDRMIDVRRNDLSSERELNNGREGTEDRENVSKHLPRTGAELCSPSMGEPNSSSISSDLYVKNIIPERGDIFIKRIEPGVDDTYTKKLTKEDGTKVARKSRDDDNDDDDHRDDHENVNDDERRIDKDPSEIVSSDNIEMIEENNVKILKRNEGTNRGRTFETIHRHDLRRHKEKKLLYDRVDESFEYIRRNYERLNNDSSYGSRYEKGDRSDESIEDSYNGIFNEIELNPPSIENFDDMLSVYDKTIERITTGSKKLDEMLEEFRLKLSVRSNNAKLTDNIDFTCSNLMAVKCDDAKLMKLNPSKLIYEYKGYDESMALSLTDEAAIVTPEEDKLQINSRITNYRSPLTNELFNLKEETSILQTYPLVEKQNDKLFDKILTFDKSNLSSVESNVINAHGVENKTLEIFSNNENFMACVPLAKNCRSIDDNDVLEEVLRRNDDESNRASFDNEESIIPEATKCLLKRQDQFVDGRSSLEKKINFERTIFNSLTNAEYNPLIVKELIEHLKMLSNAYDHDLSAILKKFFTNPTSRETDLILDLSSIRKRDYESEKCFSVKAVERDNEFKVQEDVISNKDSFDVTARSPMQCKRKSIEICRLNTVEIEDTDKGSIDESNQNEIRLLEKSTQYEVSQERRDVLDCEDRIIKDVSFDGKCDEQVSDRKSDVEEYSAKLIREYYSNSTKSDFTVNDNTDKNDEGSDINTIVSNPHLTAKLIDKLSEGEEDCRYLKYFYRYTSIIVFY